MGKRGFAFSFGWIFSIIVGAMILFLAIYGATKFVGTEKTVSDTETAREIGVLLNPLETSVEDNKIVNLRVPRKTRIFNNCKARGNFGIQEISVAQKAGIGDEWPRPGVPSSFYDRYIFSKNVVEGERFKVLSKPFDMPFRAGDVMVLWNSDKNYCFVDPIRSIEEDIEAFERGNATIGFNISSSVSKCPRESRTVCFSRTGCDVDVTVGVSDPSKGVVEKDFVRMTYSNEALLWGAIFSDPGVYECQVKRLMGRVSELSYLYAEKTDYLESKGCRSNLGGELRNYAGNSRDLNNSKELIQLDSQSRELRRANEQLSCELF